MELSDHPATFYNEKLWVTFIQFFNSSEPNLTKILAALYCQAPGLALTNLVLDLVNLVTNLAKSSLGQPSQQPEQT